MRIPAKIIRAFPEIKKEIRVSLKTGYKEEAKYKSNHIFLIMSMFFVDSFEFMCNNLNFGDGCTSFNINQQVDEIINFAIQTTKGFDKMFNINSLINKRTFGFETHTDGLSLKSLQGNTKEELDEDYKRYKEYLEILCPQISTIQAQSNVAANVQNHAANSSDKNNLKKAKFSDLLNAYAEHKRFNGWEKPETYSGFYQKLKVILELIGDIDCSQISQSTANKFLSDIIKYPANANKGKLAKLTIEEKLELSSDKYKKLSK